MTTAPGTHWAYLLLGSNIDPERNLPAAVRLLERHGKVVRTSRVWESPPVDGSAQANYLNAAVLLETIHSAAELRGRILPEIEAALGRVRDPHDKYAARTIDIDIALFDRDVMEVAGARIPDPDISRRAFVAVPLAEIAPDYVHPLTGQRL
ncbi:MAG: 2-amino-4-hydroxy-6-hydroxymethyldihydropteridine diphosphokinase, partial [Planctomycetaceae bacterium]|nr:2-amino-4-hydroxy-6-hydroxymethyldihydropteridine diphosphokinase [Planctomycetaceae bacterium]